MLESLIANAEKAFKSGRLKESRQLCETALSQYPRNPAATLLLGLISIREQDFMKGEEWLKKALELSPDDYIGLLWLPIALRSNGKPAEAIEFGERARRKWPNSAEVLGNLALDYYNIKAFDRSEACLVEAIKVEPRNPSLHRKLGSLYEAMGRDGEAAIEFGRTIEFGPNWEEGYTFLARLFVGHGNYVQALEICEKGLSILPASAQLHLIHAQALRGVSEFHRAEEELQAAIRLDENIVLAAALWLNEEGRFGESEQLFKRSIAIRPVQGVAYQGISKTRKATPSDLSLLDEMLKLEEQPMPPKEKAALEYALGKTYDDLKQFEKAMIHFDRANELKFKVFLEGKAIDRNEIIAHRNALVRMFDGGFLDHYRELGNETAVPIFVIGMIRSGTTLLEQILSSHPEVGGAGEQRFWTSELPNAIDYQRGKLDRGKFVEMRDRYLQVLRSIQPTSARITDKMPMNFYHAGFIHLAFPNAPIIHIRRNPVDTALSIYMTDLAKPPEFAHRKENIVFAYREYLEIMKLWREVLPSKSLLEVDYEELVADQESATRRILNFCGLPWDPTCLQFHENQRQVNTPSMWQVRQPIYRSSVEKWRNYEPWLGEFADLKTD